MPSKAYIRAEIWESLCPFKLLAAVFTNTSHLNLHSTYIIPHNPLEVKPFVACTKRFQRFQRSAWVLPSLALTSSLVLKKIYDIEIEKEEGGMSEAHPKRCALSADSE